MSEMKDLDLKDDKNLIEVEVDKNVSKFTLMQRQAKLISQSDLAPTEFKNNLPNCFIALDVIERTGLPIMTVLQNLYVIYGKPSFSSKFLIAMFNKSGRYSAITYEVDKIGSIKVDGKEIDNLSCVASTTELSTGKVIYSPKIDIQTAVSEGWYGKKGSKWQTIPELMLRYRSASFLINTVAPELTLGISSAEEIIDSRPESAGKNKVVKIDDTAEVVEDVKVEIIASSKNVDVDVDADKSNNNSIEDFLNNDKEQ